MHTVSMIMFAVHALVYLRPLCRSSHTSHIPETTISEFPKRYATNTHKYTPLTIFGDLRNRFSPTVIILDTKTLHFHHDIAESKQKKGSFVVGNLVNANNDDGRSRRRC